MHVQVYHTSMSHAYGKVHSQQSRKLIICITPTMYKCITVLGKGYHSYKLTKFLWKIEEWFGFADFTIGGPPKGYHDLHRALHCKIVEGWGLEDDSILMVDVIGTKTALSSPWLEGIHPRILLLLIEDDFNVIWERELVMGIN